MPPSDLPQVPATAEEALQRLFAISEDKAFGDDWRVKVLRKDSPNAIPDVVAVLEDARVQHFQSAETWISRLAGGGPYYELHIWHAKTPGRMETILKLPKIGGPPRTANPEVVRAPGWTGPRLIIFPEPGSGEVSNPGAAPQRTPMAGFPAPSSNASPQEWASWLAQREREVEDKRHKMEIDGQRREHEAAMRRMEERFADMKAIVERAAHAPPPPRTDFAPILQVVVPAVASIVSTLLAQGQAQRDALLKIEEARSSKPLIPPELLEMVRSQRNDVSDQMKAMGAIHEAHAAASRATLEAQSEANRANMESLAALSRMTVNSATMLMEMAGRSGEAPEEPWVAALREGARALAALAQSSIRARVPPRGAAPAPGRLPAAGNGRAPASTPPPTPPPSTPPAGEPVPGRAPPPPENPTTAVAGVGDVGPAATLDAVEDLMRTQASPVEVVNLLFRGIQTNPEVGKEIQESGGIENVVEDRLGVDWLDDHPLYMKGVAEELGRQAEARGVNTDALLGEEEERAS